MRSREARQMMENDEHRTLTSSYRADFKCEYTRIKCFVDFLPWLIREMNFADKIIDYRGLRFRAVVRPMPGGKCFCIALWLVILSGNVAKEAILLPSCPVPEEFTENEALEAVLNYGIFAVGGAGGMARPM